ncbi:MAG: (2Fe-2S) ferredoxin domain-containing protein [Propionibacteriaceae bacterium]|nr:(2Fe-2S) ferredoxin domain-containing protein [Propionibacteriaceae bacterium]
MITLFVTITLADAGYWPQLNQRARELGAYAAVLQGEGPGLVDQLDALAGLGHRDILLAGVTLGETGVPASWVGHVGRWWRATRGLDVTVRTLPRALRALPEELPVPAGRALRSDESVLTNDSWEEAPAAACHLLVCRGPRCSAKGGEKVAELLGAELHRRGLLDDGVLVTQTGCLYPCNQAPVVTIQPGMEWVGPVTPERVSGLVDDLALRCAQPVQRARTTPLRD